MTDRTRQLTIAEEYVATHPRSQDLHRRAMESIPGGVTHDIRFFAPFPIYGVRAQGSHKWDVDGHEYIDYGTGHGSLMLGHGHSAVVAAVTEQMSMGTHLSMSTELEVQWAELITSLIPSAERVRFVSSGTEATSMAIRLGRAWTGKPRFVKFQGHFHGWHDYATMGMSEPFDTPVSKGVPNEVASTIVVAPPHDIPALEKILDEGDVAGVILEPTGAHMGSVPLKPEFLYQLREITAKRDVLLVFDEVVTGFRVAPGGAQSLYGIKPDLTTLAKILAGGLPGGAVAGRADILGLIQSKPGDAHWQRYDRIQHQGTFNANPLSASAGVAALTEIAKGQVHEHTNEMSERLRDGLNKRFRDRGVKGYAYGDHSIVYACIGPDEKDWNNWSDQQRLSDKGSVPPALVQKAMYLYGVDLLGGRRFILSAAHSADDIDQTIEAYGHTLDRLAAEGAI